jgi:hypothetical protein
MMKGVHIARMGLAGLKSPGESNVMATKCRAQAMFKRVKVGGNARHMSQGKEVWRGVDTPRSWCNEELQDDFEAFQKHVDARPPNPLSFTASFVYWSGMAGLCHWQSARSGTSH